MYPLRESGGRQYALAMRSPHVLGLFICAYGIRPLHAMRSLLRSLKDVINSLGMNDFLHNTISGIKLGKKRLKIIILSCPCDHTYTRYPVISQSQKWSDTRQPEHQPIFPTTGILNIVAVPTTPPLNPEYFLLCNANPLA
jgi:hypothetical protein